MRKDQEMGLEQNIVFKLNGCARILRLTLLYTFQVLRPSKVSSESPSHRDDQSASVSTTWLSLEKDLLKHIDEVRTRLIANMIINNGIRILRLKDSAAAALLVALIMSALMYFVGILLNVISSHSISVFRLSSALASCTAAFSLGAVKILHDVILPPNAKNIASLPSDEDGIIALRSWFRSFSSIPKQFAFSLFFGVLCISTLAMVERHTTADFDLSDYFLGFIAIFSVSHGGYSGILIPTLAKAASQERMRLFWLDPAASSGVKMASSAFAKLSWADALFVTLCMIGLYWFKPWESRVVALISGAWLVAGWVAVSHSFLYPHYYLSKAIRTEKYRQMANIQSVITSYRARLEELDEDDFKKLSELINVYERVAAARETSIDLQAFRNFATSLVIPTLSFLGGLVDVGKLLRLP